MNVRRKGKGVSRTARIITAVCIAVTVLGTAVGVTYAVLQAQSQAAANEFTGAAVNVGVVENGNVYEDSTSGSGTYPSVTSGNPVAKTVAVKNITSEAYPSTDTYVRVRLVPAFIYDEGERSGQIVVMDLKDKVTYTFAEDTAWRFTEVNGENYYYYTEVVAPGEITSPLLNSVTYTGAVPENAHFELKVLTEGIAANQTSKGKSCLSAWGITDFNGMSEVAASTKNISKE